MRSLKWTHLAQKIEGVEFFRAWIEALSYPIFILLSHIYIIPIYQLSHLYIIGVHPVSILVALNTRHLINGQKLAVGAG